MSQILVHSPLGDILAALRWQAEMGVDLAVEDAPPPPAPVMPPDRAPEITFAAMPHSAASAPAPSVAMAADSARARAEAAHTLDDLTRAIHAFEGCGLKKTAVNTVVYDGVPHSPVMFIGEAPGAEEDAKGIPFCGASGQLLDKMLGFAGFTRAENFLISNCIYWRPPGNRQPTPEELAICQPFVERMIALNAPKLLVAVGGTAAASLLGESRGITKIHGQVFEYANLYLNAPIRCHVLFHPSYLLRQPVAKKQAWEDMLALKAAYQGLSA